MLTIVSMCPVRNYFHQAVMTALRITTLLFVLVYASSTGAEQQDRKKWLSICSDLSSVGGAVMRDRQKGVSKTAVMEAADGNRVVENLVEMAYMAEMRPTQEERQAMIKEFETDLYQKCEAGAPFK